MTEIRAVRAEIERAITEGGLDNDPLGLMLRAIASSCEVVTEASDRVVQAKRTPFDAETIARLSKEITTDVPGIMRQQAGMILEQETTKLTWRRALLCLGIAAGAFLAGAGVDHFDRPSLTDQVCRAGVKQPDPKTQRPVCSISLWAD